MAGCFASAASVAFGTLANALSVGAKTVNGPPLARVSASPALVSSDVSVVNCPAAIAVWTMFFSPVEGDADEAEAKAPSVTAASAAATSRAIVVRIFFISGPFVRVRRLQEAARASMTWMTSFGASPQAAGRRPLRFLASSRTSAGRCSAS